MNIGNSWEGGPVGVLRGWLSAVLVAGCLVAVPSGSADAAASVLDTPTVAVDALPTVQIDGVAWAQATIGNTVYVTGSFANARPAGAAVGTSQTAKQNILAYDITTGSLNTAFQARLNAQGQAIAASPDGTRVYVGGDFTSANGVTRGRLVAFNSKTGALISTFAPTLNARVSAIAVIGGTVYVGGSFTSANGVARTRLAAYRATDGALLGWAPTAGDRGVYALAASTDGSTLVVGGKFSSLNGVAAAGLGAVSPTTGETLSFAANAVIKNSSDVAGITSLKVSGAQVYGTGYVYGAGGNLEGAFSADAKTGAIKWIEDCHGDSYDSQVLGDAVYVASHAHYCGNVSGQPQTNPWSFQRAMAWSKEPSGSILPNHEGNYFNFGGQPAPAPLSFWPIMEAGTYSGQGQAAWSATGNSNYIAFAGEFPTVNNKPQQGLVRFAVRSLAPNSIGPEGAAGLTPRFAPRSTTSLRVAWSSAWDRDDNLLNYRVTRNGATVFESQGRSRFWDRPVQAFVDTGLSAGSSYSYRVYVSDSKGRVGSSAATSFTMPTAFPAAGVYAQTVRDDGAASLWRFDEAAGRTVLDHAGGSDLVLSGDLTRNVPGPVSGNAGASFGSAVFGVSPSYVTAPSAFTIEAWIRTTTKTGGKIVGFGNLASASSTTRDRQLYMGNDGKVYFGLLPRSGAMALASSTALNDGVWHLVVGTLHPRNGAALYVDGKRVAATSAVTVTKPYSGYWHVGGDSIGSYPSRPSSDFFTGSIDEVATYNAALTNAQIDDHWVSSGRSTTLPASPSDSYATAILEDSPDFFWRIDEPSGSMVADSARNGYPGSVLNGAHLGADGIPGTPGSSASLDGIDDLVVGQSAAVVAPQEFSVEVWFKTTTQRGGKLIGFGSAATGLSDTFDRHIYMDDSGRLVFGTWHGGAATVTSPASYNDGAWHMAVGTLGQEGLKLYVDGVLVESASHSDADVYSGYWRVGGDRTWGSSSLYFAGQLDEAAAYASALSEARVKRHFEAAGGHVSNALPVAAFSSSVDGLTVGFDASTSRDPDGSIAAFSWDFGDGTSGAGPKPTHTYKVAGSFAVSLKATDDQGATDTVTHSVTVVAPPVNALPVALFASSADGLTVAFDASTSNDPDGSIAAYAWNFGDGDVGAGAKPIHTYGAGGSYDVKLVVSDGDGATGMVTHSITVLAPTELARDDFERNVASGWGSAAVGGSWATAPMDSTVWVPSHAGSMNLDSPAATRRAWLSGVSTTDADMVVSVSADKAGTGSGIYAYVVGRRIALNREIRARVRLASGSRVGVSLTSLQGSSTDVALAPEVLLPGTIAVGAKLKVRVRVQGTAPAIVQAKVWVAEDAEPAEWLLSASTDVAALQAAGGVGVTTYLGGTVTNAPVVVSWDDLRVVLAPRP